jgi:hypothetical protein
MLPSFFHHLHPPTIPAPQARYRYTLGAGGLVVYLTLVLILTGALERFYYVPSANEAAQSVQAITFLAPFGWLVRNLHFWAAQLLVLVVALHLLLLALAPYLPPSLPAAELGRWFPRGGRRMQVLVGLLALVIVILSLIGWLG